MKKSNETIGHAWMREASLLLDKANLLESEFGAGLMVGVGGSGLAIALSESPKNWLFVFGSVVSLLGGALSFLHAQGRRS